MITAVRFGRRSRVGQDIVKGLAVDDLMQARGQIVAIMEENSASLMGQLIERLLLASHVINSNHWLLRQDSGGLYGIADGNTRARVIVVSVESSNVNGVEYHTHS